MKMGKLELFGDQSDSECEINTNNAYAKNYNVWRKKEELHKLKTKYGEGALDDSDSSSSSEDEEVTFNEEDDKAFFKTLACLKSNDPRIYDKNYEFFKDRQIDAGKAKKIKEKPLYPKDYQRKMLLEKGAILSDEESELKVGPSYVEEQQQLKEKIIELGAALENEDDEDGTLGGLLQIRKKTKKEEKESEEEYRKWLKGQTEDLQDEDIKAELKPLRDFWNDPKLDEGEKYLRDYFLNKRYLEEDNGDYIPTYEEIVNSGDENEIETQEEFEHKFNFRFEEPDQEFIKRYPRTIENSLRRTDDKRKEKRAETKERKRKEKEEKMAEIKKLQELKRKEIEEKLQKLKEVTGDLAFQDEDVDGDFDPEAHDKRMQAMFNDQFYEGHEDDVKPEFPDIDKELEIENWSHGDEGEEIAADSLHCEDDNFNMDADYDSTTALKQELGENSKGQRRRKRKSKVAEALNRPKPKFDPHDKDYEKYFDEYYKLDCEDIIGDIPCRFKYREVIPNDFGLTVEEILLAKDKELNKWCSIKKAIQRRPDNIEKYDQIAYSRKAKNLNLKKKILPSLFADEPTDHSNEQQSTNGAQSNVFTIEENSDTIVSDGQNSLPHNVDSEISPKEVDADNSDSVAKDVSNCATPGQKPKSKRKEKHENLSANAGNGIVAKDEPKTAKTKKRKKKCKGENNALKVVDKTTSKNSRKRKLNDPEVRQGGKQSKNNKPAAETGISDARLSAFGINAKKYRNKLKYGKKQTN